jgi:VanZ family protein
MFRLALIFVVLIIYGSLFPFTGWSGPQAPMFAFLFTWSETIEKADLIQNILAYAPLGLFLVLWLKRTARARHAFGIAIAAGTGLSLAMESIQQFIPARVSSNADLAMNVLGTLAGALLALFLIHRARPERRPMAFKSDWMESGTLPNLGLATLALWVLSQTSPLVPTLDIGQLRSGLSLLYRTLQHPQSMVLNQAVTYACYLTGLGLLTRTLARAAKPTLGPFFCLVALVFVLKIIVEGRQLSSEALIGALAAFLILLLLTRMNSRTPLSAAGIAFIAIGFVISELAPGTNPASFAFNWIPFAGQMNSLSGLQNILEIFWPFFAIAYFARRITPTHRRTELAIGVGLLVLAALLGLEWMQQSLPGRFGDITQVMLGCAGWVLPWSFRSPDYAGTGRGPVSRHRQRRGGRDIPARATHGQPESQPRN